MFPLCRGQSMFHRRRGQSMFQRRVRTRPRPVRTFRLRARTATSPHRFRPRRRLRVKTRRRRGWSRAPGPRCPGPSSVSTIVLVITISIRTRWLRRLLVASSAEMGRGTNTSMSRITSPRKGINARRNKSRGFPKLSKRARARRRGRGGVRVGSRGGRMRWFEYSLRRGWGGEETGDGERTIPA